MIFFDTLLIMLDKKCIVCLSLSLSKFIKKYNFTYFKSYEIFREIIAKLISYICVKQITLSKQNIN